MAASPPQKDLWIYATFSGTSEQRVTLSAAGWATVPSHVVLKVGYCEWNKHHWNTLKSHSSSLTKPWFKSKKILCGSICHLSILHIFYPYRYDIFVPCYINKFTVLQFNSASAHMEESSILMFCLFCLFFAKMRLKLEQRRWDVNEAYGGFTDGLFSSGFEPVLEPVDIWVLGWR